MGSSTIKASKNISFGDIMEENEIPLAEAPLKKKTMGKDNLELWNRVQETDPKFTKTVKYGTMEFTSINAAYQVKNATKEFGLYGAGWGIKEIDYQIINDLPNGEILVLAKALFYFPSVGSNLAGVFPISSTIKMVSYSKKWDSLSLDDEWAKKIETDITTKALSKLGFNADVFLGMYDDNRYVNALKEKANPPKKEAKKEFTLSKYEAAMKAIEESTEDALVKIEAHIKKFDEGKYYKLAMKGVENKKKFFSQHPPEK